MATNILSEYAVLNGMEINSPAIIAAELRLMAAGEDRYSRFTYMSPWIKNIWNAAADIIDDLHKSRLH